MPVVLASRDDDARRAHLRDCARCQALQRMYEAFMTPATHLPESERRDAVARLRTAVAERSAVSTARAPNDTTRGRARWFEWIGGRNRWALAAVVVAIGAMFVGREMRPDRGEIRLREATGRDAGGELAIESMRASPDGGFDLDWKKVPGADAYELRFYSADLREVARLGPLQNDELTVRASDSVLVGAPDAVLVRVVALRAGAPLTMSRPRPLPGR